MRIILLLALLFQCTEEALPKSDLHILFVGNSLTYVNNLPSLVAGIAEMDGVKLTYTTLAAGNYSLDDHWAEGTIQSELKDGKYDFLIAQQGPSALPESQVILRKSSVKIAKESRKVNTTFGLYMVWPSSDRSFDHDNCITSYTNAAKEAKGLLCPAGLAWKYAWKKDAGLPLYGPDRFHPGIHGSVLAAMVIYASVKEKKDLDFITSSKWDGITDDQLAIMKSAAIKSITGL